MIARNYDWFMELFVPVVIGQSNCFGFGFLTVFVYVTSYIHHKPLWKHHAKPATFAREDQTTTPGTISPSLYEHCVGSLMSRS